eukprot:c25025_g1_i1 orf=291-1655(-)
MTQRSCSYVSVFIWLLCCGAVSITRSTSSSSTGKSEEWGYVEVREGAHMFWWLYRSPNQTRTEWPLVLWLQGGPGASGVGIGNFEEFGPLTTALLPRPYTWLQKADLLFVDSPVGAGFSYVENTSLLLTKDEDVATDLISFLRDFFETHQELQSSSFFIFAESYGGKHATLLGLALNQAIKNGSVKAKLGGVALGDSWISPIDSVLSWGPVLKSFSRIDDYQEDIIQEDAKTIQMDINNGAYLDAFSGWESLENTISILSNKVDFYNLLYDQEPDSSSVFSQILNKENVFLKFGNYLKRKMLKETNQTEPDLTSVMNGPIRKKLQIIPETVIWKEISGSVFSALEGEFMRDVIPKVDELLADGVNLTIYSGQLDLICATQGTEAWVRKLKWAGMASFQGAYRKPLYCNSSGETAAFVKSYKNLAFYWILLAGHMVPADNPCIALDMVELITNPK